MANTKIVKNNLGSPLTITDVGITIAASSQYTLNPTEFLLWAQSNDIIVEIGNGNVTINDGSSDLGISDGTDLIKGVFQKHRIIGDTDSTLIGNVEDALKVTGVLLSAAEEGLEIKPVLSHQADWNKMMCLFEEIIRQLRMTNEHLACISDIEGLDDPEEGDDGI